MAESSPIARKLVRPVQHRSELAIPDTDGTWTATVMVSDVNELKSKLSSRLGWCVAAGLLLSGCEDMPRARTESEIHDIAADVADDVAGARAAELSTKIEELEGKVGELETEKRELQAEVEALKAGKQWSEEAIDRLYANDRQFAQRLGMPVDR